MSNLDTVLAKGTTVVEPKSELRPALNFEWRPMWAKELFDSDHSHKWLCKGVLVAAQPAVIGGPVKTLKTSIGLDLAISLATGRRFLGRFPCPERKRVIFMSSESGAATLKRLSAAICEAKGITKSDLYEQFAIHGELPQLSNARHLAALQAGLTNDRFEVVFLDPLYLALLAGASGNVARAENLYEIGPLLLNVAQRCLDAGAAPILMHHTRKGAGKEGEPLDLTDLAFSGVAEFARQWILLSRRERYDLREVERKHSLWMVTGGSAGHSGLYSVAVDEGLRANEDCEQPPQEWKVTVGSAADAQAADQQAEEREDRDQQRQDENAVCIVLGNIDLLRDGLKAEDFYDRVPEGVSRRRVDRALTRLVDHGTLEKIQAEADGRPGRRPMLYRMKTPE